MLVSHGDDFSPRYPRRHVRARFRGKDNILRISPVSQRDICLALGGEHLEGWIPWLDEPLCLELYKVVEVDGRKVARSLGRTRHTYEVDTVFFNPTDPRTEVTILLGKQEDSFKLSERAIEERRVAREARPPTDALQPIAVPKGPTPEYLVPGIRLLAQQEQRQTTLDRKPMAPETFFRLALISGSRLGLESHWENLLASALVLLGQAELTPGALAFALSLESAAIGYVNDGNEDVWSFKNPLACTPFEAFNGGDCEDGAASAINRAHELSLVAAGESRLVRAAQTILRDYMPCAVECVMMRHGVMANAGEQPDADLVCAQGGTFHVVFALVPKSLKGPVYLGETCKMVVPRPEGFAAPEAAQPALRAMDSAGGWNGLEFVKPFALIYTEFVRLFVPAAGCSLALTSSSRPGSGKTLAEFLDLDGTGMVCDRHPMQPPGLRGFDFIPPGPLHCPERLRTPPAKVMVVLVEPGSDKADKVLPGLDFQGQIFLGCEVAHWSASF